MSFDDDTPQIRLDRIPVGKSLGALAVIIVLIGAMLVELPSLRVPVIFGAGGGCVLAAILIVRHAHRRAAASDKARIDGRTS